MTRSIPMEIPEEIAERVRAMVERTKRWAKKRERARLMADAYALGAPTKAIAYMFKVRQQAVSKAAKRYGVPLRRARQCARRDEGASKGRGG